MTLQVFPGICRVVVSTAYRAECPTVRSRLLPLCRRLTGKGFHFTFLVLGEGREEVCPGVIYDAYPDFFALIRRTLALGKEDADLLFACKPYTITGLISLFVARWKGLAYVLDVDDRVFPSHIRKWWRLPLYLQEWLSEKILSVIRPPTTVASLALVQHIGSHVIYLPNSAELDRLMPAEPAPELVRQLMHRGAKILIWPAYFFQETDRRYIVDILRRVQDLDAGIILLVVGEGECLPEIKDYAARSGVSNIVFAGPVEHSRMAEYYAAATAGILPLRDTHYDACKGPIKLYEFMAMGLPVIATDIGEPAEMIRTAGCGLLLPFREPQQAAEQLADFLNDAGALVEAARAGRQYLEMHHNFEVFARRLEGTFRAVLNPRFGGT